MYRKASYLIAPMGSVNSKIVKWSSIIFQWLENFK